MNYELQVKDRGEISGLSLDNKRVDNKKTERPFTEVLKETIQEVNRVQSDADRAAGDLAMGRAGSIHEVMIALEKANVSFRFMVQVRNKIIEAYQEIMRMQV
jgi:flagellar hook-basal body complex protein FliE